MAVLVNPPCVLFEDEHLLVVNKPPGWNTHSPAPYAGEGIYEWLKNREPRWAKLAIIHRLDKETSGLLVFSKTAEANRSLTQQFTEGKVRKEYVLQSTRPPPQKNFVAKSRLKRVGERYASSPHSGLEAETEFELLEEPKPNPNGYTIVARPRTGRTHQIRVHASENGFPIFGDALYGGAPFGRLCLHSTSMRFEHPTTRESLELEAPPSFNQPVWLERTNSLFAEIETNAHRLIHGASDGFPGWHVDLFDTCLLSQSPDAFSDDHGRYVKAWLREKGIFHKTTTPHVRGKSAVEVSPKHISGPAPVASSYVVENSVNYEINFSEGYSVGIFLDQRDNRRRLLINHVAADYPVREGGLNGADVLNTFAYTCAFSVCAALAGTRVTSLDLSKKYLDWGRRNFQLNGIDAAEHDFIYGDVFDWLKRFAKKQRQFDIVLLDPPTFSKSKESGIFRAEDDYGRLVVDALKVLKPGGVLFASSNVARWAPEDFVKTVREAVAKVGRKSLREHYVPQPPDFPISKAEPAYLKTMWLKVN